MPNRMRAKTKDMANRILRAVERFPYGANPAQLASIVLYHSREQAFFTRTLKTLASSRDASGRQYCFLTTQGLYKPNEDRKGLEYGD